VANASVEGATDVPTHLATQKIGDIADLLPQRWTSVTSIF
jgi:hypothetical protein